MLDDATKRALEMYTERMAAESSRSAIQQSRKIQQHIPNFQQYKELNSKLHFINSIYPTLEPSSSSSEPQNRKKRRRTSEEPTFQPLVASNQINVGLTDKYPSPNRQIDFLSWPQNFNFQSGGTNQSLRGFESKSSSYSVKNHSQLSRKSALETRKNLSNAGLLTLDRDTLESQKKDVGKCTDFSKEIEDAISRIESLIPSLQELVNSVHAPEEKSVGELGLPNISSSLNNYVNQEHDVLKRTNELCHTDKSGELGEIMVGQNASQMMTQSDLPNPSRVNWSKSAKYANDDTKSHEANLLNVRKNQRMVNEPLNQIDEQNDGRMRNLDMEKISNAKISQVPRTKAKAIMSRPESLKRTPSRIDSSASDYPEGVHSSRIMPHKSDHKEAKDATLKPRAEVASVGSTSFKDHESTISVDTSYQKLSRNYTNRRNAQVMDLPARDSLHRNDEIMKVVPHDQTSGETSRSSSVSSGATTQESGSPSSSSGTYHSYETEGSYDSEESEPRHEKVGLSTRGKQPELSESNSGYDDDNSLSDNSQEEYSNVEGPSSSMSSVRSPKWELHKQRGEKARGRIRKFGKKIGMIFHHHHHHHHHHHYGDKDEPDVHHAISIWKRFGEIFHHTKNAYHRQRLKTEKSKKSQAEKLKKSEVEKSKKSEVEKPRKSEDGKSKKSDIKTLVKKKAQLRQFYTLAGGLMKHMKHIKKTKQVKNGIKKLRLSHSKGKTEGKKLPWWPKFHRKRSGVKVPNKGKVKFQNFYRTKSLAAAKMILGKKK